MVLFNLDVTELSSESSKELDVSQDKSVIYKFFTVRPTYVYHLMNTTSIKEYLRYLRSFS